MDNNKESNSKEYIKVKIKQAGEFICSSNTANKIRKYYSMAIDAKNVIGSVLVTALAPEFLPLVPLAQKISKTEKLGIYDMASKIIVKDPENLDHSNDGLSDKTKANMQDLTHTFINNVFNDKNGSINVLDNDSEELEHGGKRL